MSQYEFERYMDLVEASTKIKLYSEYKGIIKMSSGMYTTVNDPIPSFEVIMETQEGSEKSIRGPPSLIRFIYYIHNVIPPEMLLEWFKN